MKPRPVDQITDPAYPSPTDAAADQRLLHDHVPRRWQLGTRFLGAVSLLVAANLAGCTSEVSQSPTDPGLPPPAPPRPEVVYEATAWVESIFAEAPPNPVLLACDAVMPPAVYSEEEFGKGIVEDSFAQ